MFEFEVNKLKASFQPITWQTILSFRVIGFNAPFKNLPVIFYLTFDDRQL